MSVTDCSASLSIGPLSVLTTLPTGAAAFDRIPLGPLVAGMPPTRNGSLSIDSARPSTTVLQPATTRTAAAHAIAALNVFRARLLIAHPRPGLPTTIIKGL